MDQPTNKRTALLVAGVATFLAPFIASAVIVALPTLGRELGLDAVGQGWVVVSYTLAAAVFLLPLGRLADIVGHRRIFIVGLWLLGIASTLAGLAPNSAALLAFRVLQGIAAAMVFGTSVAIVTATFEPSERGRAMGFVVASAYVGLSAGPVLGGLLTQALGWRSVLLANVPIAVGTAILTQAKLKGEWAEARGERFDLPGALIYGVSLAVFVLALSQRPLTSGLPWAAAGMAGLVAFALWEARAAAPLLDVRLLAANHVFALSNLAALASYGATAGTSFLLSLYLQHLRGLQPRDAGMVLLAQPVVQAALSPFAGRLSDTVEPRIVASCGMATCALGLALFATLRADTPLAAIVAYLMLLGLGFALFSSPNTNAVMGSVDRRHYGVASGTLATMRLVGQTLSNGLVMLMLSLYVGSAAVTPAQTAPFLLSARMSFALFAAICLAGTFASLVRGKMHAA